MGGRPNWPTLLGMPWLVGLMACGGTPPSPYFRDAEFLRFGVDPRVEAEAVEAQTRRAGYDLQWRTEGTNHVALGLRDEETGRTAVRVVSSRGTVLSLDSDASPLTPRHYTLLTLEQLRDVDRMPADEVFVRVEGERDGVGCLAAFRVTSTGTLSRIVVDGDAVIADGCASEIADVNGDGSLELIVHAQYVAFGLESPPLLRIPLSVHAGGYRLVVGVGSMLALFADQRAEARRDLADARHRLDVERALRAGVELSAMARFEGESTGAQLKTLDDALVGLVLTGRQAALVEHARKLIRDGWEAMRSDNAAEEDALDAPESEATEVGEPQPGDTAVEPAPDVTP